MWGTDTGGVSAEAALRVSVHTVSSTVSSSQRVDSSPPDQIMIGDGLTQWTDSGVALFLTLGEEISDSAKKTSVSVCYKVIGLKTSIEF